MDHGPALGTGTKFLWLLLGCSMSTNTCPGSTERKASRNGRLESHGPRGGGVGSGTVRVAGTKNVMEGGAQPDSQWIIARFFFGNR